MKKNTKVSTLEPKRSRVRSKLEMLNWLIGIVAGLIFIWQVFFPQIFKPSNGKTITTHMGDTTQKKASQIKISKTQPKDIPVNFHPVSKREGNASSKQLVPVTKDTTKSPKYNVTGPITNSAIGDNASVTNNYGDSETRHLSSDNINKILKAIPSKDFPIEVDFSSSKRNSRNYGNEIANYLIKNGYKVDVPIMGVNGAAFYPPLPESDRINIQKSGSIIKITVVNLD